MNKTANYNLNQWDKADRVLMEDFNADNAKIDAALGAKAEKTVVTALQGQVNTVQASVPKIACGTYTGNGTASRTISLPFAPKAVLVLVHNGYTRLTASLLGGLALSGSPVRFDDNKIAISISGNGFQVFYDTSDEYRKLVTNSKDQVYHYIAIG